MRRSWAWDSALEKRRNPRPPKTRDADGETRQGLSRGRGLGVGGAGEPSPPGRVQGTRGRVLAAVRTRRRTGLQGLRRRAARTTRRGGIARTSLRAGVPQSPEPAHHASSLPEDTPRDPADHPHPVLKVTLGGGSGAPSFFFFLNDHTATGSRFAPIKDGGKAVWSPRELHGLTSSRRGLAAHAPECTPPEGMRLGREWVVSTRAQ